ncbi:MAG TPA: fumarylacetoacetate hydrolase family protein [Archangium sp.]|uniref:2-keto-4-pentenoate hydratase n=1 Tax=Archangium sp. TaxID=1872627 RepID=UPI002E37B513|nr:fumarylacetoacetate hydrolase family protein [Archangium sp.]HEX5752658.1 fumarylacetoacetate hydrolase family protein [Archangium sp.]
MSARMHEELARLLDQARLEARAVPPLTRAHPTLSLPDGYAIQAEGRRLRTARGEHVVGLKMGFTSEAKRKQMNLDLPIYGFITDRMAVPAGGTLRMQGSIHPRIEPEIAFRTSRELRGRITREQALDACSTVFAAMEILDSRFVDFKYFSLPDVVADNTSASHYVLSTLERPPRELDLPNLQMVMEVNGERVQAARSDAISGDPVVSILQLCELLDQHGQSLPAGSIVLSGAATAAQPLRAGDRVRLTVEGLGELSVSVAP